MNKWQIICPVVAMMIAAMIVMSRKAGDNRRSFLNAHARMISEDLLQSTNSAHLTEMPPQFVQRLSLLYRLPSFASGLTLGDAPSPEGNGKASFHIFLRNSAGEVVGIRIGQVEGSEKFRVLNYWDVTEDGGQYGGSLQIDAPDNEQ